MTPTVGICGSAFRLPERYVTVQELRRAAGSAGASRPARALAIPKLNAVSLDEVDGVHVCDGEGEGTLAATAIDEILQRRGLDGRQIGLLIDYSTVSKAANGLSLCYRVQSHVGAEQALTLAIGNGSCISLQLALQTAAAFMRTHEAVRFALLFSEDRVRGRRLQPPAHVLGDGASALLLERDVETQVILDTVHVSMGKFCDVLGINHWQDENFDVEAFENRIVPLHYKITRDLVLAVLAKHGLTLDGVDVILYQNMSQNDYRGLAGALDVGLHRIYTDGLRGRGHIFGADLVINLFEAGRAARLRPGGRALLISSGAGFSWGVSLVTT